MPAPLVNFPASLGLAEPVEKFKTVKTLGSLLKLMPQNDEQAWLHAARMVRWAANPRKTAKKQPQI